MVAELTHPLPKAQLLGALLPRLTGKQKEDAVAQLLTATLSIENVHATADLFLQLIPKLAGTARKEAIVGGLEKVQQLEKEHRMRYLISYLPFADDNRTVLQNIRQDLLDTLAEIRSNETREAIFSLYQLLFKTAVPPVPATQISDHLIAICRDWQWPAE